MKFSEELTSPSRAIGLCLTGIALFQAIFGFIILTRALIGNKNLFKRNLFLLTLCFNDTVVVTVASVVMITTFSRNAWIFGEIFCYFFPLLTSCLVSNSLWQQVSFVMLFYSSLCSWNHTTCCGKWSLFMSGGLMEFKKNATATCQSKYTMPIC